MAGETDLTARLTGLVANSGSLWRALQAARTLGLSSWCIGAGAVRNLVWDHLHGFDSETPASDLDLVFYDDTDLSEELERFLQGQLAAHAPEFNWEVVNQAGVHRWLAARSGRSHQPLRSLVEGVASWPETATCVGVSLSDDGQLRVLAPHGLDDLFNMVVRWNPTRAPREVYLQRLAAKRFNARWPRVRIADGAE